MGRQRKTKSLLRRVNRKGHSVKDFLESINIVIVIIPTISNEVLAQ